jgi:hypothetical protein
LAETQNSLLFGPRPARQKAFTSRVTAHRSLSTLEIRSEMIDGPIATLMIDTTMDLSKFTVVFLLGIIFCALFWSLAPYSMDNLQRWFASMSCRFIAISVVLVVLAEGSLNSSTEETAHTKSSTSQTLSSATIDFFHDLRFVIGLLFQLTISGRGLDPSLRIFFQFLFIYF